jgi:hypothetical protein
VTAYVDCGRCGATITDDAPCDCPSKPKQAEKSRTTASREVVLTRASSITPRPVKWIWFNRFPLGSVGIAAGREGTGKSQFGTWKTAAVTRGTLPGELEGEPRAVIYAAFEDSWEQTLVPRLIAAGADLDLVYRIGVRLTEIDADTVLSLPADLDQLEEQIGATGTALLVVDPLLSTIHGSIDTHKNRDVRMVLDPLVAMADRARCAVLGIAHHNKASGGDASSAIVGSGAFKDVPRAVFSFARDEETGDRVMTQSKNSLGSCDLPSLAYRIAPFDIDTPEGPAHVSRLEWDGEAARTVDEMRRDASGSPEERSDRDEAAEWLRGWLSDRGGDAPFADVVKAATADGIAERTLKRARSKAGVTSKRQGFGSGAVWSLGPQPGHSGQPLERGPNGPNGEPAVTCDRCGDTTTRTITHHETGAEWCPRCCRDAS